MIDYKLNMLCYKESGICEQQLLYDEVRSDIIYAAIKGIDYDPDERYEYRYNQLKNKFKYKLVIC